MRTRFARPLATLAVAAAVPLAASATLGARAGLAQQTTITTIQVKTTTKEAVEPQQAEERAEIKAAATTITVEKVEVKAEAKAEPKAEAKAEKKAVAVNRRGNAQQNLDPWIQQMTPQLRPMVRAQLHVIATACSPTADQRKEFAAEGERVLKEVARDCASMQTGQGGGRKMTDPNRMIAEALAAALHDRLTPEQRARYEAENKARAEDRKRLVVRNLVASLDDDLVLAPDQRAAIVAALEQNYDESWCSTLQVLMYGTQFFPQMPDHLITPTLTPNQKNAWNKRTRNGTMAWWNFGHNGNAVLLDDEIDPAPAPAAAEPAAAKKAQ